MEYQKFNDDQEAMVGERILCVSDLHYPFNLPLDIFTDYVGGIDTLVLNGDLLDCMALSRFQKSYRISPIEEMIGCRQYLIDLIKMLKPARVIATNGNHEYRLSSYVNKNIDCEIKELMPDSPLEYLFEDGFTHYDKANAAKTYYPPLKDVFRDIDFRYTHGWWYQYGGIIFCHPKAFSSGILKTSEKALMWFRNNGNIFDALVMAHTHRIGMYKIGGTMLYEQGCCCDTAKMQYSDGMLVNSQKEGFLLPYPRPRRQFQRGNNETRVPQLRASGNSSYETEHPFTKKWRFRELFQNRGSKKAHKQGTFGSR